LIAYSRLDPKQIKEIRNLIKELAGKHTVILSTHILRKSASSAARVIIINKGKVVAEDRRKTLQMKAHKRMLLRINGNAQTMSRSSPVWEALKELKESQCFRRCQRIYCCV